MEPDSQPVKRFTHQMLPWLIAAAALLVYLGTLNHWVTLASLPLVSKVTAWDTWMPTLQAPLYLLVTYPVKWLPVGAQPLALNFFTALCGAGALGLLARSVALLPHDRTANQRQREHGEKALLSIPVNWIPPIIAAAGLGLTATFWERAVVATGEVFNLLLFAYVIRCLLEFRISQRESWLLRMAFVYGLAITNNWAMIGFLALFLAALIWIKGTAFFNWRFIAKMSACGLLGLLPYLFLPALEAAKTASGAGFWDYLRIELGWQKNTLLAVPRWLVLILALFSVLPVIAMGIRWPTHIGDVGAASQMITQFMLHLVHALFLVACVGVIFDWRFSPRALTGAGGGGLPFLTFYYLSALALGYFSGYFLLVFSPDPGKPWRRQSSLARLASTLIVALIWVGAVGVPVALAYRNLPAVRANNGPALGQYAGQLAKDLPQKAAVVLSDNPLQMLLLQAHYARTGTANPHLLLDTRSLPVMDYHRTLARHYPGRWPDWAAGKKVPESVNPAILVRLLLSLSTSNALCYLHPSFGYYFENFHMTPRGAVEELKPYSPKSITPPPLTAEELKFNQQTWSQAGAQLDALAAAVKQKTTDAMIVGRLYSRALDYWGVQLQRHGRHDEAQASFARAIALNPDNRAARVNSESNEALRRGLPPLAQSAKTQKDIFGPHRDWNAALNDFGPYDEPRLCFQLGRTFVQGNLPRQGLIEIIRARTLDPTNLVYRVAEMEIYLQGNLPDQALATLAALRKLPVATSLDRTNQFALIRLEAMAQLSKTNFSKADQLLLMARQTYPDLPAAHEMLAQSYMLSGRLTNALPVLDHQLKTFPADKSPLMNKAAIYFRIKAYEQAIAALDALLKTQPDHLLALQVRAASNVQLNRLDAAKGDYERIRQRSPKLPAAEFGLGEIAYLQKKKPDAVAHFEAYLKLVPPGTPDAERARQRLKELKGGG